jgi:hypothetical protein
MLVIGDQAGYIVYKAVVVLLVDSVDFVYLVAFVCLVVSVWFVVSVYLVVVFVGIELLRDLFDCNENT